MEKDVIHLPRRIYTRRCGSFSISGEKISSRERAVRLAAGNAYIFHLTYRYAIDGQTLANTARYINHSCDPNCAVEKTSDTIWIIALREILQGKN
jgi:SET domain-containing protein